MLRSKSVSRLLGGAAAALLLAADLTGLRAGDEQFQLPLPANADPAVTANFPTGDVPPAPAAAPANTRWAQRNQQMQAAAAQGTMGTPQYAGYAQQPVASPQQPMDLSPAATQTANGYRPQMVPAPQPNGVYPTPAASGAYTAPSANGAYMAPAANGAYMAQASQRLPFSGRFNSSTARPGVIPDNLPEAEQVKTPSQLPKVTQIMPFLDYEPDPKVAAEDPCQNLCPRPDGAPCKTADGKGPECPNEVQLSNGPFEPRVFPASTYTWQASNVFYQPLYFEDPDLERYGHAWPFFIQPIVSSLRFTVQSIGIPYQMTIDPCCCRVYPLGFYRPGECAPKLFYQIPWNTEAAAVEAGSIAGVYFLFPHSAWSTAGGIASP
jgi:hypothetical protein